MPIELGASYEDVITGFRGVATGYVQYITGCNQTLLAPRAGEKGKLEDPVWFDEQRLRRIPGHAIELETPSAKTGPGPDLAAPIR